MTTTRRKVKEVRDGASLLAVETRTARGLLLRALFQDRSVQTVLSCCALFSLALGLNLYHLGGPSLWFDEVLSVTRARQPLPVLLRIISATQPNMALYYIGLHFWLDLTRHFGFSLNEAMVRFPSAVCAALGSLVLYFLARRFVHQFVVLCATLCYLLNTLQLTYAQEARSYSLQLIWVMLSWYALCVLLSGDLSRKWAQVWWSCFVLSSVLAVYSQLFSVLILAAQTVAFVLLCIVPTTWRPRARQQLRPFLSSCAWIGILIAPLLYISRVGAKTGWLPVPHLSDLYHLFFTISSQNRLLLVLFTLLILLGLCVISLVTWPQAQKTFQLFALLPREESAEKQWQQLYSQWFPLAILLLCWLLCPVVISYLVSQRATRLFSSRYLVVVVPAFVLLAVLGLAVLRWRPTQIVAGLCLCLLCASSVPGYFASAQVEDWRTGTQWLGRHYLPGDGLICYDNSQGCAASIEYYLQAYPRGLTHFDADSPGYFSWINYDLTNQLGDSSQALNIIAIQTYASKHPRLFFGVGRANLDDPQVRSTLRWLSTHSRLLAQEVTSTLTIYLYATEIVAPPDLVWG